MLQFGESNSRFLEHDWEIQNHNVRNDEERIGKRVLIRKL